MKICGTLKDEDDRIGNVDSTGQQNTSHATWIFSCTILRISNPTESQLSVHITVLQLSC